MKRKKIFYVPGLFSAIVIPLVFWYYASQKLNEPKPNMMDIWVPPKYNPKLPNQISMQPVRNFNFKKIIVQPNSAKKNSARYVSELREMQRKNKEKTGIEFILNRNNSYGDFVSILNDLEIAKHNVYGIDLEKTGNILAIVEYKDPNEEPSHLYNDTVIYGESYFEEMPWSDQIQRFYDDFQDDLLKLPKNIFYIVFGFLIFLNISVYEISRKSV